MSYVYLALNWIFGVLFFMAGLLAVIYSPFGGFCLLAIALLLLPPVRNFIFSKTNKGIPTKVRAISIFVLLIGFGVFITQYQNKAEQELVAKQAQEHAEKVAQARQANIDHFIANREQIISSVKTALYNKKYQSAISQSSKYLVSGDKELEQLNERAKQMLAEIIKAERAARVKVENEAKTKEILAKLKTIPASQYQQNKNLYQQLVDYNSENDKYKQKLSYYSKKLREQQERTRIKQEKIKEERNMRIAKFGERPIQSAWDGSYYPVERYLERIANDPDSIKIDGCTKVYRIESGWLVGCDYRGRNAFGGMIRQSNWFTIIHDRVIQMHDASAYKK